MYDNSCAARVTYLGGGGKGVAKGKESRKGVDTMREAKYGTKPGG